MLQVSPSTVRDESDSAHEQNWQLRQGEEYGKTTGNITKAVEIDSSKETKIEKKLR
jgi:hypothetical protein